MKNSFFISCVISILFTSFLYANDTTKIENLERGMTATIKGEVIKILDEDEFRIKDSTGKIKVYIGWKNRVQILVGETIELKGFVDDGVIAFFRPEFYAFEITREDGTVIKLN